MRQIDVDKKNHQVVDEALGHLREVLNQKGGKPSILLISPNYNEYLVIKESFPAATFYAASRKDWDLNSRPPRNYQFDLVVASNVFMYSASPGLWFDNVLSHSRYFVIQDLIDRKRSPYPPFLGSDEDVMRYSYSPQNIRSRFSGAFDLGSLKHEIVYFRAFEGEGNEYHAPPEKAPYHFCAVIKSGISGDGVKIAPTGYWGLKAKLYRIISGPYFRSLFHRFSAKRG